MAKYKAYPEYKDSGVEWLGCVPTGWLITELKRYSWVKGGYAFSSDSFISFGEPVIRIGDISQDGSINLENCKYVSHILAKQSRSYTVRNGELLMAMTGATIGKAGFYECEFPALINQRVGLFKVLDNLMHYRFLWYTLKSYGYQEYIKLTAFGGAQPNISDVGMVGYRTTVPSLQEQSRIASFLDHETAKIDNLIEKQQQLIELLKEKRQAVISHAVTKGLNPDVPMKDSGVEWLGEVPAHWGVMPVKYVCALIKDGTHLPPPRVENGIPLLSVRNIIGGVFQFRDDDSQISHKDYKSLCSSFIPKKDDVLLAIVGATLGKVALVPEMDSFHIQRSLGVFRTNKLIHPQHLSYIFESKDFQNLLWENAGFSAQPGIYLGTLSNFCVPIPPVTEQLKISEFITATVDKLDLLITQASKLIGLIQERRTALISAAVTGKIDVRDWVAPETQDVEEPQEATA
ncbi:restriction endonuclease subunit S [Enterobacter asburiae]|uniref:restriction endonuclease subunit S n=1 Tax=Enterobacter asburiae TaxID=61645 RepID=UPI001BDFA4B1|nr:restriction endonuclease subunit S [Enterobacter asburiae]MBT2100457.1 restriction endonuclease subunit S [Enterobacter asburiae]MDP9553155.1 type I restriction enzyme S subunit [Enterobacter mori]MDP9660876.1 type I restriction enzyme S subunit [Enterobacter mori]